MIQKCKTHIKKSPKTTIIGTLLILVSIVYAFFMKEFNVVAFSSFILLGVGLVVAPDKIIGKIKL